MSAFGRFWWIGPATGALVSLAITAAIVIWEMAWRFAKKRLDRQMS